MVLKKIVTLVLIVVKNEHTEWGWISSSGSVWYCTQTKSYFL